MPDNPQLTIVIPCYNEAENIPSFFPDLLDFAEKNNYLVIAVNDGSRDSTGDLLKKFSSSPILTYLSHKCNKGYGAALKTGLRSVQTPFAITIDADGQHQLADVKKCFEKLLASNADLVVGSRQNNVSGGYRSIGKWIIRSFAKSLLTLPVQDLNSGMKCYRIEETRQYLSLCPNTMAFSEIILLLMVNDRKLVTEEPITVIPRQNGRSTIDSRTALITLAEILNIAILLRPLTTFLRLSVIFMVAGLGWSIFTFCKSGIITVAGSMLIIFSLFCAVIGLVSEQLSHVRRDLSKLQK